MADDSIPKVPTGTRAAGKRLWAAVLADYVLEQHELGLLREMVRTTDVLDELDAVIRRDGLIVAGPGGADRCTRPPSKPARHALRWRDCPPRCGCPPVTRVTPKRTLGDPSAALGHVGCTESRG